MKFAVLKLAGLIFSASLLLSCSESSKLQPLASYGPNPVLPEPSAGPLPTIHIAKAIGWPVGTSPVPAAGLAVQGQISTSMGRTRQRMGHQPHDGANSCATDDFAAVAERGFGHGRP